MARISISGCDQGEVRAVKTRDVCGSPRGCRRMGSGGRLINLVGCQVRAATRKVAAKPTRSAGSGYSGPARSCSTYKRNSPVFHLYFQVDGFRWFYRRLLIPPPRRRRGKLPSAAPWDWCETRESAPSTAASAFTCVERCGRGGGGAEPAGACCRFPAPAPILWHEACARLRQKTEATVNRGGARRCPAIKPCYRCRGTAP
jgi:hypothetical protein